jgi:phosphoserine phosphatase RsbU/P
MLYDPSEANMSVPLEFFRDELQARKQKLTHALHRSGDQNLARLLQEVDAALERADQGTFGLCQVCLEPIENERLLADPLVCACLGHLSPGEQAALENDLGLAAQVQRKLLPPQQVDSHGWKISYYYQPLGIAGGDYCDILPRQQGVFFLLGDVSGKGVAASMLAANLHGLFRTLLEEDAKISESVRRANRIFCESTLASQYATLICGRAGLDGRVEICNAGHCTPYLVRADGDIGVQEQTELPLGVFCESAYTSVDLRLQPGDALFLYSDGLSECLNADGEEYGNRRLPEFLKGTRLDGTTDCLRSCLDDLAAFRQEQRLSDDLSVMVVSRVAL